MPSVRCTGYATPENPKARGPYEHVAELTFPRREVGVIGRAASHTAMRAPVHAAAYASRPRWARVRERARWHVRFSDNLSHAARSVGISRNYLRKLAVRDGLRGEADDAD